MRKRIVYILFVLSLPVFSVQFDHLTTEDGLSSNHVFCIAQDTLGFMWFGTSNGLNRWDGYDIREFRFDPADLNSLSSNNIKSLYVDRLNILWIGTGSGLNRFDPVTEQFLHYPLAENNVTVMSIWAENDVIFWLGTYSGLYKFNTQTGACKRYLNYAKDPVVAREKNAIFSLSQLDNGLLLVGTNDEYKTFDRKTERFADFFKCFPGYSLAAHGSYVDRENKVWLGYNDVGLGCYDQQSKTIETFDPQNSGLSYTATAGILEDSRGRLWVATLGGGVNLFDKKTKTFSHFIPQAGIKNSISTSNTKCLFEDKQGNIWIGSYDNGVNKIARWRKDVTVLQSSSDETTGLGSGEVFDICQDRNGDVWITSLGGGVKKVSPDFRTIQHMVFQNDTLREDKWMHALEQDRSGNIWLSHHSGFYRFNWQEQALEEINTTPHIDEFESSVHVVCEDSSGDVWFGTVSAGLIRLKSLDVVTIFKYDSTDSSSLRSNSIQTLFCDPTGQMWIGHPECLSKFNVESVSFEHFYLIDSLSAQKVNQPFINAVYQDHKNRLWIGTHRGFFQFDREKNLFIDWTHYFDQPELAVIDILEDGRSNLWLRSSIGIIRFNPKDKTFRAFKQDDGFSGENRVAWGHDAFYKDRSGCIYYGGIKTLARFHPDSLRDNPEPPRIVLTEFSANYKNVVPEHGSMLEHAIPYTQSITLPDSVKTFSIKFSALDYTAPQKNQYAFKLEGFHKNWIFSGSERSAAFTNLSPGRYTFRVKACNCDGVWNEEGISLAIHILPPWWQSWWAYVSYALFVIGLVLVIYRAQLGRIRLKQQAQLDRERARNLEELDSLKTRFFANISHEFRTPLTLILGPLDNMSRQTSNKKWQEQFNVMRRNGRKLLRLINQLLDVSRLEAGKMVLHRDTVEICFLLRGIVGSFSSAAERKNINLSLFGADNDFYAFIDHDAFEKILTNLLSNALKFTPKNGAVDVVLKTFQDDQSTQKKDDIFSIQVKDTGIGISMERIDHIFDRFYQVDSSETREHEGTGIGLALTKELVELHGGIISVQSEPGNGSTFTVQLPVGEVQETPSRQRRQARPLIEMENVLVPEGTMDKKDGRPILLIVEDNVDMQLYIKDALALDYTVKTAGDGERGFNNAVENIPDLIISDVMMPVMDGFALCEKLKTDERTSHIPIILLTARAEQKDRLAGLETGADDYLVKPFDVKELQVRVKNLIESRVKMRERFQRDIGLPIKEMTFTSTDERFLQRAIRIVHEHISDSQFSNERFGEKIGMSRMHVHRKIRALTGQSTNEFIKTIRLKYAAQLLKQGSGNVSEIAFEVGFESPSYFSKCFRKQFGLSPREVKQKR
ncbi:hybrid sensor histidine kinase/response regulator [candidate division KSB1 bacterium]|nr:response regulator [candidate division KSB1 bacterium]RQW01563.1 MAG: hybrid sensor histidine kinase/response regulator [candidate division KSB1 bacterium]